MFITLPKVFDSMNLGGLIGGAFFILVLFAALTSSISLLETNGIHCLSDKLHWGRKKATIAITIYVLIIGGLGILRLWTFKLCQNSRYGTSGFL